MKRNIILYLLVIGFFGFLIWWVIDSGKNLKPQGEQTVHSEHVLNKSTEKSKPVNFSSEVSVGEQFFNNIKSPLGLLLLQIITILLVSKLFGVIFTKIN